MGEKSNIYTNQSQCLVWQLKLASCSPSSALSTVSDTLVWFFCILGLDWNNDCELFLALHGHPEIPRTSGLSGSYILENGSTCRYTMKNENFSKLWGGGGIVCKEWTVKQDLYDINWVSLLKSSVKINICTWQLLFSDLFLCDIKYLYMMINIWFISLLAKVDFFHWWIHILF